MGDMLRGRVAVITGAGNGLGRAHAIGFAAQGARVVVNDLGTSHDGHGASHGEADAVVEQIRKAGGVAVANYASVAEEDGAKSIIQQAVDEFGRIDILVNNAGIIRHQDIDAIKTDDWDLTIKTHLYGMMYCTRAATAYMKKQNYGRILCTSSHIGLGISRPGVLFDSERRHRRICAHRGARNGPARNHLQRPSSHRRLERPRAENQESYVRSQSTGGCGRPGNVPGKRSRRSHQRLHLRSLPRTRRHLCRTCAGRKGDQKGRKLDARKNWRRTSRPS